MKDLFKKRVLLLKTLFFVFCSVFYFNASSAQSVGLISVDFEDDPLFEIDNFYPGMSVTKDVTVRNDDVVERDLYVTMSGMDNDDFADQISFYVIKKSSGKYFVGGEGDRMTLRDIDDDGNAFLERMAAGDSTEYEIKVKLKTNTGNEFQNEEIDSFEVGLAFSDLPNPPVPPYRPGQLPGGNEEGVVEGAESDNNEEANPIEGGVVSGEQAECHSWPLWSWISLVIIYVIVFLWSLFNNFKDHIKEKKIRWGWPLIIALSTFLFWYNFDKCQQNKWFIVSVSAGSLIVYLYYLKLFNKGITKKQE